MLFGLMLAYWINYGFFYRQSSLQWRFPLAFQAVFAIYCITVTVFLPDTPRWLLRYSSSPEKGVAVLARLRGKHVDDVDVQREKKEILDAIEIESREEGTWLDLCRGAGMSANKRFYLALGIQFMQQMSGGFPFILRDKGPVPKLNRNQHCHLLCSNTFANEPWHEPASFTSFGIASAGLVSRRVFRDCKHHAVHPMLADLKIKQWYTIDRIGRRKLFISMAIGMSAVLIAEAICVSIKNTPAAIAAVVFVFAFEACFTWGTLVSCPKKNLAYQVQQDGWQRFGATRLRSYR